VCDDSALSICGTAVLHTVAPLGDQSLFLDCRINVVRVITCLVWWLERVQEISRRSIVMAIAQEPKKTPANFINQFEHREEPFAK